MNKDTINTNFDENAYWKQIEKFFMQTFQLETVPDLDTMLFLIGVQEVGKGKQKYKKDDKVNLIHVAVCRVLEPFGYYKFIELDKDDWPVYELVEKLPNLQANEQQILMKKAIINYFREEELI